MWGHRGQDEWGWPIALAPGAFVFAFEGLAWALSAATGWEGPVVVGYYVGLASLAAAVAAPLVILATWQKEAWTWAIVSVCVSFLAFLFAFIFWFSAAAHLCGPQCFS